MRCSQKFSSTKSVCWKVIGSADKYYLPLSSVNDQTFSEPNVFVRETALVP